MATVDEIMSRPYARVLVPDESGGYFAEILELPDCFAEGDTSEEAFEALEETLRMWAEVAVEDGEHVPEPLEYGSYNGRFQLRMPKSVHRDASQRAQAESASLNQWMVTAITERLGVETYVDRLTARIENLIADLARRIPMPRLAQLEETEETVTVTRTRRAVQFEHETQRFQPDPVRPGTIKLRPAQRELFSAVLNNLRTKKTQARKER